MAKPTLTLEFDTMDSLRAFLNKLPATGNKTTPAATGATEAASPLPQTASPSAQQTSSTVLPQTAAAGSSPLPSGETAAGAAVTTAASGPDLTVNDVRTAMTAYIGKGAGRTAATARALQQSNGIPDGLKKWEETNPSQDAIRAIWQAYQA